MPLIPITNMNLGPSDLIWALHSEKSAELKQPSKILKVSWIDTILGQMVAIADDKGLYLLEFVDKDGLRREIERFILKANVAIAIGSAIPIESIALELQAYFDGKLTEFKTPIHLCGTSFQKLAWEELLRIPYGQTRTYKSQAEALGKCSAYRAVANANANNQIAIAVPCHRIINSSGNIGGYSGGIMRKKWLIDHEKGL